MNPYDKTIFGVGCLGVGKYKARIDKSGKTLEYNIWVSILQRCYDEKYRFKYPAYKDSFVCDEWLNFQNFAQWYNENIYYVRTERMHIDKDILVKNNKEYAPDKCIIIPQRINMLFHTKTKERDADLPNAIYRCATGFQAIYNGKSLGVFETVNRAAYEHDMAKKRHIEHVANEYKDELPPIIYEILVNWNIAA